MDHNHMSLDLRGKKIVSVTNGEIIGEVVDVLVDPQERRIAALVTSRGNLFRRETQMLANEDITVIGKHVILSNRPDVVRNSEDVAGRDHWVGVSDHLRGNDVVTSDGTRIGRLQDIIVDPHGQIVGYALSNITVEGPIADNKQIPADSIQSFGKDVVIVDPSVVHTQQQPLKTESDRTDFFGRELSEDRDEYQTNDSLNDEAPVQPVGNYEDPRSENYRTTENYPRSTDRDYLVDSVPGEIEGRDYRTTEDEMQTDEFRPSQRDVRAEDYHPTVEDLPHNSEDYPRRINQDFEDEPVKDYDDDTIDYRQTRDYQKPRFSMDDEERRRDDV
jgi:uncharacterized protein YrrD